MAMELSACGQVAVEGGGCGRKDQNIATCDQLLGPQQQYRRGGELNALHSGFGPDLS